MARSTRSFVIDTRDWSLHPNGNADVLFIDYDRQPLRNQSSRASLVETDPSLEKTTHEIEPATLVLCQGE